MGAGETEEQHRELVDFARDFAFERMGAFAYSAEDGTPAASMAEQVRGVVAMLTILLGRVGWVCTAEKQAQLCMSRDLVKLP